MTDKAFWESKWQQGQTGWDLKGVSPAIKVYIDQLTNKNLRILIPGCGNAYEAEYLLQQGFNHVTVIDIAPTLTDLISKKLKPYIDKEKLCLITQIFCAINPNLRASYAKQMYELLTPNGKLVGLLFNTKFDGGPPFGGNVTEYETYFKPYFKHISFMPSLNSITPRSGKEVWIEVEN